MAALPYIFWISTGLVIYTYAVYPLLLIAIAGIQQVVRDMRYAASRGDRRRKAVRGYHPRVSLVFSAYNEEAVIAAKMENCRTLTYPTEMLEILAGCDGCSDRTAELARAAKLPNLTVFDSGEFAGRSGKPEVLNRLVKLATGEFVIFSDANTMLAPDAIALLARHFNDPEGKEKIGCVCGELRVQSRAGGPSTEGAYWRYEVFLKFLESRLGLLLGANGGVFAIRRDLFTPLPKQAIIDDFLVAMRIHDAGYSVVYDPEATALEEAAAGVRDEFKRRVRIGAGNFHALRFTARLLSPTSGRVFFSYWSHKILRWLVPFALPLAFAAAVGIAECDQFSDALRLFCGACAAGGLLMILLGLVGYRLELRDIHRSIFSVPYYFLSMNLALLLGFVRFVTGEQTTVWHRTARETPGPEKP
jgi:cellulose synthase/poly-beta-1,6-N-acetylglucosamine synthase-like glycosyltransferase